MKLKDYLHKNELTQNELAGMCTNSKGEEVSQNAVSHGVNNGFIVVGNTVYSPRFQINEGVDNE